MSKVKVEKAKHFPTPNMISRNDLIEIQTEAYYKALKKIEEEKNIHVETGIDRLTKKERGSILWSMIIKPKHIKQSIIAKTRMTDVLLNCTVTLVLDMFGYTVRTIGLLMIVIGACAFTQPNYSWVIGTYCILVGFGLLPIGGIFNTTSKEIEKVKDIKYLFNYSSGLMATMAVLVALIGLIFQLFVM